MPETSQTLRTILATVSVLALVGASEVGAQVAAPAPVSADEIVVTAQRRAERLEDVPISITAVSAQSLERAGISRFDDLEKLSPGTRIARTGLFVQPAIRGITSTVVGTGQENNIAIYVDGFYQPDSLALGSDLANIRDVQILKGPQGTLYGRNATGGAILVNTLDPSDERIIASGELTYGNFDDKRARAYVGVPITKGVSIGVGGYLRENDGYVRTVDGRDAAPYRNREVRVKLKLEPSSNLNVIFGYNYIFRSDPRGLAYTVTSNAYLGGLPVPPIGPLRTTERDRIAVNILPQFRTRQLEGTMKVQWRTPIGTLTNYLSFIDQVSKNPYDIDGTGVDYQRIYPTIYRKTLTQSADFAMEPFDTLDVVVGGLYLDDKGRGVPTRTFVNGNLIQTGDTSTATRAYALFGDVTLQIGDKLFLNGGARYSHERKTVASKFRQRILAAGGPGVLAPPTSATFSDVTPRATIRYEFNPGANVYASYSQGFKSGTFNSVAQTFLTLTTPVKPEKVEAYEVGFKLARSGLRFETAAYYYDYRDLQVSSLQNLGAGGTPFTILTNAATARIYGAEASVSAAITDAFNVNGGVAYTHARYRDYPFASVTLPINGRNFGGQLQDFSGRRIARAPDWTANIGADYTIPIGDGRIVAAASAYYSSRFSPSIETYAPATGDALLVQKGYVTSSATLTWHLPGDHLTVSGFVQNIGNKRVKIIDTAGTQGSYSLYSEPRTYGLKVGFNY